MIHNQDYSANDYLSWSIVSFILCPIIFGVLAFYYSIKTLKSNEELNFVRASKYSYRSLVFNVISSVLGFGTYVGLIFYFFIL
jgi:hypothetical protein